MIYRVSTCFNHPFGGLSDIFHPQRHQGILKICQPAWDTALMALKEMSHGTRRRMGSHGGFNGIHMGFHEVITMGCYWYHLMGF